MRSRLWPALVAALTLFALAPAVSAQPLTYPPLVEDGFRVGAPPDLSATTWILYDEATDSTLAAFAPDTPRAMASTTKIMTGLVAIEEADLDDLVIVSQRAADTGEREIGLVPGEQLSLGDLLKAALIHSGNDAATAIAEHVGGSVEEFVALMNQRAAALGLENTRFANPHGLDAPGHYSSARDMLELAREAMRHREFRDIVRSRIVVFPEAPDGSQRVGEATNLLLDSYEGATGIKTGFTNEAMLTFVASAERQGRELIAVVLGSDGVRAHLADARELLDYGFGDLGVYGLLATEALHVPLWPRADPGPLTTAAALETLVHLSATGLMGDPPEPTETAPEPAAVSPVVTVTSRQPDPRTGTLRGALTFWLDRLEGD